MKSKTIAVILAFFLGMFGAHRFYLGQKTLGFLYVVLFFIFGISFIIALIDVLGFLFMSRERFDYLYNKKYYDLDYQQYLKRRQAFDKSAGPPKKDIPGNFHRKRVTNPQEGISQLKINGKSLFKNYEFEEAVEVFEQVLAYNSHDAAVHFNLACCFSILENRDRALRHIALAVENGFDNFERIDNHPSLAWIRIQEEWVEFKESKYRLKPVSVENAVQKENSEDNDDSVETDMQLPPNDKLLVKLKKLKDLRDRGLISDVEFVSEKKKIL
ncbi:MAG: TM2 domain-containing protein [Saprospirales bacterium]|nr:MAG: TM2 domain-containing protein [Saprospirales bacterium]